MTDMEEMLRLNPKAAEQFDSVKDALDILHELRAAGIAQGDKSRPLERLTIADVKGSRRLVKRMSPI